MCVVGENGCGEVCGDGVSEYGGDGVAGDGVALLGGGDNVSAASSGRECGRLLNGGGGSPTQVYAITAVSGKSLAAAVALWWPNAAACHT